MNGQLSKSASEFGNRLVQFENEWSSGQIPDVAGYLRQAGDDDRQFIEDLIEIDLECRWKKFDADRDPSSKDPHGFPLFPLVDDYASVLPQSLQQLIFTPRCVAEEYRVRSRWGDKPAKDSFLERFHSDRTEIEAALHQIDTDFENEGIEVAQQSSVSNAGAAWPTVILGRSPKKDSKLVPEEKLKGTLVGKYELETRLGHGGFGEVWKAYDPALKRHVAIKFPRSDKHFPAEHLEIFRTEAQKLAALDHIPGIVDVFDCGEHDGKPYFVSKFIEGESLADRMQREQLSHQESAALIAKVAETLKRAHQQKLVHRDIKPANILLDKQGEPYVADFGMAATEDEQLSEEGAVLGTYAYMAPEQARGESHRVDGRADIYALGVILYRLLTNELPYGGKTTEQYLDNIQHQKPRPPRQIDESIPAELERICLKCLKKDEEERYSSAGELAGELRTWDSSSQHITYVKTAAAILLLLLSIGLFPSIAVYDWITGATSSTSDEENQSQTVQQRPRYKKTTESDGNDAASMEGHPPTDIHNLLAQPITELIFDHDNSSNNWDPDDKTGELKLRSYNTAMLSFGSLHVPERSINVLIEPIEQKPSEFGIFWGLHEINTLNDGRAYRAKCLLISHDQQFVGDKLTLMTLELVPHADTGMRISKIPAADFETKTDLGFPSQWEITLTFRDNKTINASINGLSYGLTAKSARSDDEFSDGQVGVLSYTADFAIKKFFWHDNLTIKGERHEQRQ